jgi:hypothetical protein
MSSVAVDALYTAATWYQVFKALIVLLQRSAVEVPSGDIKMPNVSAPVSGVDLNCHPTWPVPQLDLEAILASSHGFAVA